MNPQDIRSLHILEEIGNGHSPSQRELAKSLNMSLGLVNSFMKRLARKGYLKITTIPRNRVRYILTPKGLAEKTRLTYQFVQYSFHFYRRALGNLENLLNDLEKRGVKRVVFCGASELAEIAFICLQLTDIKLTGIVDDVHKGKKFRDVTVQSIAELDRLHFDSVLITTVDSKGAIYHRVRQQGVPGKSIVMLE